MLSRIIIAATSFLVGLLVALVIQESRYSQYQPEIIHDEPGKRIHRWPGESRLREDYVDEDQDGTIVHWNVSAWFKTEKHMSYWFFDENDDGQFEDFTTILGDLPSTTSLSHYDLDEDGSPDLWQLFIRKPNEAGYWYEDIDDNGRLDMMGNFSNKKRYVLLEQQWVVTTGDDEEHSRSQCTVKLNGEPALLKFQDGHWRAVITLHDE